jgi:hypothetical protein
MPIARKRFVVFDIVALKLSAFQCRKVIQSEPQKVPRIGDLAAVAFVSDRFAAFENVSGRRVDLEFALKMGLSNHDRFVAFIDRAVYLVVRSVRNWAAVRIGPENGMPGSIWAETATAFNNTLADTTRPNKVRITIFPQQVKRKQRRESIRKGHSSILSGLGI